MSAPLQSPDEMDLGAGLEDSFAVESASELYTTCMLGYTESAVSM